MARLTGWREQHLIMTIETAIKEYRESIEVEKLRATREKTDIEFEREQMLMDLCIQEISKFPDGAETITKNGVTVTVTIDDPDGAITEKDVEGKDE